MNKFKHTLIIAICVTLALQVYFDILVKGFIISLPSMMKKQVIYTEESDLLW